MSKCDIEAAALKLTHNEREALDREIKEAKSRNENLGNITHIKNDVKERIDTARTEKKEFVHIAKSLTEKYRNLLDKFNRYSVEGNDPAKFEAMQDALFTLKEKVDAAKLVSGKHKNENFKQAVDNLVKDYRSIREQEKLIKTTIKDMRNRLVDKMLQGNLEGARRDVFRANDNPTAKAKRLVDALDQAKVNPNSLWSTSAKYQNTLFNGLKNLAQDAKDVQDDITHPKTQSLINAMRNNINSCAEGLGIFEKAGLNDALVHPVHISSNVLFKQLFKGVFNGKFDMSGLEEFKRDLVDAMGLDEVESLIKAAYIDAKSSEVPTLDDAFTEMHNRYTTGSRQILSFSRLRFKSQEKANIFIKKYSNGTMVRNYMQSLQSLSRKFAASEVSGGYIDDPYIKGKMLNLSEKQRNRLMAYRDAFFGVENVTSAKLHKTMLYIRKVQSTLAISRVATLITSPFGDKAMATASTAFHYAKPDSAFGQSVQLAKLFMNGFKDAATGGALKMGFSKNYASDASDLLRTFNVHTNLRLADQLGDKGKWNPSSLMINWFENVDEGLRVVSAKSFATMIRRNSDLSFDELSKTEPYLHRRLIERHGINADDWEALSTYVKDNDMLVSSDFNGALANKVASIEYTTDLQAIPNKVVIASNWGRMYANDHPIVSSILTMFWQFLGKLSYYSGRTAIDNGGLFRGVGGYMLRLSLAGFAPNVMLSTFIGLMQGRTLNNILSDKSLYAEAMLGPFGRYLSLGSLVFNPSSLAYIAGSPITASGLQLIKSSVDSIDTLFTGKEHKNAYNWIKFLIDGTPIHSTPLAPYFEHQLNSQKRPRKDGNYQKWIQNS